ncbi:MAG: DUF87 domain-containing protein [Ignavibacteriae bacterium]|nr:DUF87 domain-containing protein [Ignavibacteriota bacterium]
MTNDEYRYSFGIYKELSVNLPDFESLDDRFHHLYLVGRSGMGKSTVMENLAEYDISQGYSVIFIDPKGESADKLYYHFKENPNVRYVSFNNPIAVNLFEKKGYDYDTLVGEFSQILDNVITTTSSNPESTVRMKEVIEKALDSFQPEDLSIKHLSDFLTDKDLRNNYDYANPENKKWWINLFNPGKTAYKKMSDYDLTMSSVASRLHQALRNNKTNVFIDKPNELDIDELVQDGKSLIINIETSNDFVKVFVANLFVGAILSYMNQVKKAKPLFVYIDEFDLVASGMFAESLQLGRSSKVGFTLGHINFSSAKSENHKKMMLAIIDSILGSVSNYLVFNTSPVIAKVMSDVFNLKISDFTEMDKYEARLCLGTNKFYINTKKPILKEVPDDFIFPSINQVKPETLDFLADEWIMI